MSGYLTLFGSLAAIVLAIYLLKRFGPKPPPTLFSAAFSGDLQFVQTAMANGTDVNSVMWPWTALDYACRGGHLEIVKVLLASGASFEAEHRFNMWPPLQSAAQNGHAEIIDVLVNAGADRFTVSGEGWTLLHTAARFGHASAVETLLKLGLNKNAVTELKDTALHLAAWGGHESVVQLLLRAGARPGERNIDGFTPADIAASRKHAAAVDAFTKHIVS
jgi:ankyrin repeat protein